MTRSAHRQKRLNKTNLTTIYETTKDTQLTTSKSAERRQKPPLSSRAWAQTIARGRARARARARGAVPRGGGQQPNPNGCGRWQGGVSPLWRWRRRRRRHEGGEGSGDEGGEGGGGGGEGDDGDEETRATRGGRAGVARAALGVCPSGRGEGGPRCVPLRGVARATRPSGGSECGKSAERRLKPPLRALR